MLSSTQCDSLLRLLARFQPAAVYLFGSVAEGRTHPGSDVDIAILPSDHKACDPWEMFQTAQTAADLLKADVDLIDLNAASTVLRKEVLRTGRVIFEGDRLARELFEMYALSDYARLNEERAPVLASIAATHD